MNIVENRQILNMELVKYIYIYLQKTPQDHFCGDYSSISDVINVQDDFRFRELYSIVSHLQGTE